MKSQGYSGKAWGIWVTVAVLALAGVRANCEITTVTYQVSADTDDGYAWSAADQNTTASYLMIGDDRVYSAPYYMSGMRFSNVVIPRSAAIVDARLKISSVADGTSGQVYGVIDAEAADSAVDFGSRYIADANRTAAAVNWDHKLAWDMNTWQISPDISSVIQAVINRPGWNCGNAIAVLYSTRTDSGKSRMFGSFERALGAVLEVTYETYTISGHITTADGYGVEGVVVSADGGACCDVTDEYGYYALIVAPGWSGTVTPSKTNWTVWPENRTYSDIAGNQTDQNYSIAPATNQLYQVSAGIDDGWAQNPDSQSLYGEQILYGYGSSASPPYYMLALRFTNTNIPRGMLIREAHLVMRTYVYVTSGTAYGQIQAEASDNACDLESLHMGLRPKTGAAAYWDFVGVAGTMNKWYASPDISHVVQEVIDRPGWSYGNAMLILYSNRKDYGTSRSFWSYDGASDYAAKLQISFDWPLWISGFVQDSNAIGVEAISMTADNGGESVTTDADGFYALRVPTGWSGTVTPSLTHRTFDPSNRTYYDVTSDLTQQNFTVYPCPKICGHITDPNAAGMANVSVSADNGGESGLADANGFYQIRVPYGWSGTVTVSKADWGFHPPKRIYSNVVSDQVNQDYVAFQPKISGNITTGVGSGLGGVLLSADNGGGADTTDASGYYEVTVPYDWSGTVTPAKAGWGFTPQSCSYTNVVTDQANQGYTAYQPRISGLITQNEASGLDGVTLSADNGGGSDVSTTEGYYEIVVPYNWSGTVTPSKSWWGFSPETRSYSNVVADQIDQDYTAFPPPVISGYVRDTDANDVEGALLSAGDGIESVLTNSMGFYELTVPYGWFGDVTPSDLPWHFAPKSRGYSNLTADVADQNYNFSVRRPTGTVLSYQKISASEGSFAGPLRYGNFGSSAVSIGDLDGDGVNDMAVGAMKDGDGHGGAGAVWVLFMSPNGRVKTDQKISNGHGNFTGDLPWNGYFGCSATSLGDLDGDAITDIAVGAKGSDQYSSEPTGAVWILFLNSDGTVKTHQKINGNNGNFTGTLDVGDGFGESLASLGDINGDGVNDLAVGASGDDDGENNAGAVWILFLNPDGTVSTHQKISNTEGNLGASLGPHYHFARAAGSIGDLDEDGNADLLVGAAGSASPWLLFLNADGTVKTYQTIPTAVTGYLGIASEYRDDVISGIAAIGDLDGNGTVDLAVGFYGANDGGTDRGAVRIIFLNADGTVKSAHTISDTKGNFVGSLSNEDYFGSSVSSLGDLDGDGAYDLVVGAIGDDDGGSEYGAVWTLFLSAGTISGYVLDARGDAVEGVSVTADNGEQTDVTDNSGYYELVLYVGWSGTIMPSKGDRMFSPAGRSYTDLPMDLTSQNYVALPTTLTVNAHGSGDYATIQAAIDAAVDGDEVILESGTYSGEGNVVLDFDGKAIVVRSVNPEDPAIVAATIIDPNRAGCGFYFHNNEDANSVVDGLTIKRGYWFGGGGIRCYESSPTIRNCVVTDCSAQSEGGGIGLYYSDSVVEHCIVTGNRTAEIGGGIACLWNGNPIIANCIITGNHVYWAGGGIGSTECNLTVRNCTLSGNKAEGDFGGVGGALCLCWSSIAEVNNTILWGNDANEGPEIAMFDSDSPSVMTVSYCDVWGGESAAYVDPCCTLNWNSVNNLDTDPCFAEAGFWHPNDTPFDANDDFWVEGDYHLKSEVGRWDPDANAWVIDASTSPCIDGGNPSSDWRAELWPHGKRINMGAYGGTPQASMSLSTLGNIADLNGDDVVDFHDYAWFAELWEVAGILLAEDLDRNGAVNSSDAGVFADNWLWEQ